MKVNQAIVCAAGSGSRLGLGVKSLIVYKDKVLVDYLLRSILQLNLSKIVVNIPAKSYWPNIPNDALAKLNDLITRYPGITFVEDDGQSFGRRPDYLRKYLDTRKPFFLFCGQSPQLSSHLKRMSEVFRAGCLVTSGYKYRYEKIIPVGEVIDNRIRKIEIKTFSEPTVFNTHIKTQTIPHYPIILNYNFYDTYPKKDGFKFRMYSYINDFIQKGGDVINVDNPVTISEIDYSKDLGKLFGSVDQIIPTLI